MIRYTLRCANAHAFESWFAGSEACDKQIKRGLVACPACGSAKVEKAIMAPAVAQTKKKAAPAPISVPDQPAAPPASSEPTPVALVSPQEREFRRQLKQFREHLVSSADYVGPKFPEQARRMHYKEIEHRSIYGEASPDEAKALIDEGIEVHPIPVLPDERN